MNYYEFEFDVVKISLIFLISFGLFSLFVFRSFVYKNKQIYLLIILSILAFVDAYLYIYYQIKHPNLIPSIVLALGPSLLYFIKSKLNNKKYHIKKTIYHFIPSVILLIISMLSFNPMSSLNYYIIVFVILHFGIYLLVSINKLISKKIVVLRSSDSQNLSSFKWVNLFNVLLTISFVYTTALIEVFTSGGNSIKFRFVVIALVIGCLFLLIRNFTINMFQVYSLFKEKKNKRTIEKYKDSILTKSESKKLATDLVDIMQNKKPYLKESISLKILSIELKTHPKILSQVINENFDKNFFDYINSYRIEDAKILLADMNYKDYKIYEIMYQVGFNSRSSFNTSFKKNTGITAKQYRERNLYK